MTRTIIFLLILLSLNVSAQFQNPVYSDWGSGYSVGGHARFQASSSAINSNLTWAVYQGNFLKRELREQVSGMHGNRNRVGADLDYGIFAKHIPDSTKGIGWFVNVADRFHLNAHYTKELFNLASFGNAQYAGETVELGAAELNILMYSQFEAGIMKKVKSSKGEWNIGLGISLLMGKRNMRLRISQADLYTDPDGEFLSGEVHGDIRSSSFNSAQYFDANGVGFSGSLHLGYQTKKFGISLQADDLGLISWSKGIKMTQLDSVFVFEGVEVNLFAADGGSLTSINLDNVMNGFATKLDPKTYSTALPGRMRLEAHYVLNDKNVRLYAGLEYRIAPSYIPYVFIGTNAPLGKGFYIDGRFAYGGFGSWNLGLELRKRFAQVFEIRAGTNNLEGYVLPMVGTSQSVYIGLTGFF